MSQTSRAYTEALLETDSLGKPPQGFVKESDLGSGQLSILKTISKQNNTIIELLIQLHKKLDKFQIEKETQKSIDDISEQLAQLSLGTKTETKTSPKKKYPFFVFKDPLLILEEEKLKLLQ